MRAVVATTDGRFDAGLGTLLEVIRRRLVEQELTDGVVTLRPRQAGDRAELIAGRDAEHRRFLGEGAADPDPTAVAVGPSGSVVGWIDHDLGRPWLNEGEVNVGFATLPEHRGRGFARRAVELFVSWLAEDPDLRAATMLIDPENHGSLTVARRTGFAETVNLDGQLLFKRDLGAS